MKCQLPESPATGCKITGGQLGDLSISDIDMAHQILSPATRGDVRWNGDDVFLKVVRQGSISIEQDGITRTFGARSVIAVDTLHGYALQLGEQSIVTVLRLPKQALRDRGLRHSFPDVHTGDPDSPDVQAVSDFVLCVAEHWGTVSRELGRRMSDQCLDFMDVMFNEGAKSGRKRTSAATLVLRAKRMIRRLARNPDLDIAMLAQGLNVSANYLTRAFKMASDETPMRYLMMVRFELASKLLVEGHMRVKEVAFHCGFNSSSHFCAAFKRTHGMSPLELASAGRGENTLDQKTPPSIS
jgi:AraC-like DNA-binding protein